MQRVSTILVEPTTLFRDGLGELLAMAGFDVDATAARVSDIVSDEALRPQLIMLGARGADADLLNDLRILHDRFQDARLVVLTERLQAERVEAATPPPPCGFLEKDITFSALIDALDAIMLGQKPAPPTAQVPKEVDDGSARDGQEAASIATSDAALATLSRREREILQCLVKGQPNKIIAAGLNIVEATVKIHVKAILRKIHVKNRTQAAIWALNHPGWLPGGGRGARAVARQADVAAAHRRTLGAVGKRV